MTRRNCIPRVSVVCIFFNEERFLEEAVASVLAQDFTDFELLLVDDGSTDGSTAIAREMAAGRGERIRYLEHPGHANRGMSAARNLGIAHARGEYLAFIDADDVWLPHKLSGQLAILEAHPEAGAVSGGLLYWRSWDGGRDETVPVGRRRDCLIEPPEGVLTLYPLGVAPASGMDVLVRSRVAAGIGGFEDCFRGLYEDQAFFAKLYLTTAVYLSRHVWLRYRQHEGNSVSRAHDEGTYSKARRKFFIWLIDWVEPRNLPGKQKILRRARRELWYTRHLLLWRVLRRLRRIASR
ncbi:MAG: glycosyltransferase family 2 protein [Sphingomonadales bacterium]|nr:glycosyltransferase family 2 protein [Sphingomonadales bacterium]MDE2567935.1 glycosyltransferase family 2 protein [Sphingomonadales bacterium]